MAAKVQQSSSKKHFEIFGKIWNILLIADIIYLIMYTIPHFGFLPNWYKTILITIQGAEAILFYSILLVSMIILANGVIYFLRNKQDKDYKKFAASMIAKGIAGPIISYLVVIQIVGTVLNLA